MTLPDARQLQKFWLDFVTGTPGCASGNAVLIFEEARKSTENPECLSPSEREVFENLKKADSYRLAEWLTAREAEETLRKSLGRDCLLSVSHTRVGEQGLVLVAGASRGSTSLLRVGIDLEARSREVSPQVTSRILRGAESRWVESGDLSGLDLWVIKEAAYKATPDNEKLLLSDFQLEGWDVASETGRVAQEKQGRTTSHVMLKKFRGLGQDLTAAFAVTSG